MGKAIVAGLGVAVAAFAVWLTVRIVNRRQRWAKWAAGVLFGVVVLYPLSAGPFCWIIHHCDFSKPILRFALKLYAPYGLVVENLPEPLKKLEMDYEEFFIDLGSPSHIRWAPVNPPTPDSDTASEPN
jgi:hypothetical protein